MKDRANLIILGVFLFVLGETTRVNTTLANMIEYHDSLVIMSYVGGTVSLIAVLLYHKNNTRAYHQMRVLSFAILISYALIRASYFLIFNIINEGWNFVLKLNTSLIWIFIAYLSFCIFILGNKLEKAKRKNGI